MKESVQLIEGSGCREAVLHVTGFKLFGVEPSSMEIKFPSMEMKLDYDLAMCLINFCLKWYLTGSISGGERRDLHKTDTDPFFKSKRRFV